jgi:hypothetical protein
MEFNAGDYSLPSPVLHEQLHCRQVVSEPMFIREEWLEVSALAALP